MATKAKKAIKPVYLVVRRLVDIDTGESVWALAPRSGIDSRIMRERNYRAGDMLRADLKKPRNYKFHCLVHRLGELVKDNIEEFAGMEAHAAIKRLQREADVCCEEQEVEIPGFGKLVIKVAQSIAFDQMEEGAFYQLWQGICRHIAAKYWPDFTEEQISSMVDLMPEAA
jgi:hypothetical protein